MSLPWLSRVSIIRFLVADCLTILSQGQHSPEEHNRQQDTPGRHHPRRGGHFIGIVSAAVLQLYVFLPSRNEKLFRLFGWSKCRHLVVSLLLRPLFHWPHLSNKSRLPRIVNGVNFEYRRGPVIPRDFFITSFAFLPVSLKCQGHPVPRFRRILPKKKREVNRRISSVIDQEMKRRLWLQSWHRKTERPDNGTQRIFITGGIFARRPFFLNIFNYPRDKEKEGSKSARFLKNICKRI